MKYKRDKVIGNRPIRGQNNVMDKKSQNIIPSLIYGGDKVKKKQSWVVLEA